MRRLLAAGLLAAAVAASVPSEARMHAPYRGHRIVPGATAPLDGFTAPAGAYSFRKLRTAYAGNAIRIRRASDNAELDVGFLGCTGFTGCPWNEAAATAHCAATTCFVRWWYDQSGLARDVGEPTPANQPTLVFNCNGSLPCIRMTSGLVLQTMAGYTPAPPITFSAVANRSAGTGSCYWPVQYPTNSLSSSNGTANQWFLWGGAGGVAAVATDNAWHSHVSVINGASSLIRLDGVETFGSTPGGTTAGQFLAFWGSAATTCNASEVISWDGYAMAPAERAVLGNNQKTFWGTP